jgi:hypothetical protein
MLRQLTGKDFRKRYASNFIAYFIVYSILQYLIRRNDQYFSFGTVVEVVLFSASMTIIFVLFNKDPERVTPRKELMADLSGRNYRYYLFLALFVIIISILVCFPLLAAGYFLMKSIRPETINPGETFLLVLLVFAVLGPVLGLLQFIRDRKQIRKFSREP